jgi:hypothetical protein
LSISGTAPGSHGEMTIDVASGTESVPNWFTGIDVP